MFSSPTQAKIKNKWKKNFFPIKEITSGSVMSEGATEETSGEEEGDRDETGGTTVHNKYTHVCVDPITVSQEGEDEDVLRTETSMIYPWIPLILN